MNMILIMLNVLSLFLSDSLNIRYEGQRYNLNNFNQGFVYDLTLSGKSLTGTIIQENRDSLNVWHGKLKVSLINDNKKIIQTFYSKSFNLSACNGASSVTNTESVNWSAESDETISSIEVEAIDLSNSPVLDGQWKLICYKDFKSSKEVHYDKKDGRSVVIRFESYGNQGHIEGHTLKNPISGQYYLYENNKIKFTSVGIERQDASMNEWGDNIQNVLLQSNSFNCFKDSLILIYDEDQKAMIFKRSLEIEKKPSTIFR